MSASNDAYDYNDVAIDSAMHSGAFTQAPGPHQRNTFGGFPAPLTARQPLAAGPQQPQPYAFGSMAGDVARDSAPSLLVIFGIIGAAMFFTLRASK